MASLEPASEMQELVERFAYSEDLRTTLCVYPSGTTRNSNYCTVLVLRSRHLSYLLRLLLVALSVSKLSLFSIW